MTNKQFQREFKKQVREIHELIDRVKIKEQTTSIRGYVDGLRSTNIKKILHKHAYRNSVLITILDHDKSWFRQTIYFEVTGTLRNIQYFKDSLKEENDTSREVE